MPHVYELTMPPSLNNMYPSGAGGGRYRSPEYDAWIRTATKELEAQRARPVVGRVEIAITLEDRAHRYDPDNRVKPLLDLLVKLGLIDGDSHKTVRKIVVQIGDVTGARVEIVNAPPPTALFKGAA